MLSLQRIHQGIFYLFLHYLHILFNNFIRDPIRYKKNLFSRNHKRNPLKTCIEKQKYSLFLQQIKRKNDGKGKYKLISSPS